MPRPKNRIHVFCFQCHRIISRKVSTVKKAEKHFCSNECRIEAMKLNKRYNKHIRSFRKESLE